MAALLGELTGRRLPQRTAPDWVLQQAAAWPTARSALIPARLPVSAEQVELPINIPAGLVVDDTATRHELAVERRELRETLADTVRWLAARGLVTAHRRLPRRLTCARPCTHRRPPLNANLDG